ncbi:MAG: 6-carboxytetrahydropterin synthase QueD [Candidatus Cloacimonetes bacterium]|nr:6-carboxytetrahydropterin synthase QueD [Candidatus Cloacimonadota bacterium]
MYQLNIWSHFAGAHKLIGYNGACRNLHGHNWKIRLAVLCEKTNDIGLTLDFKTIKKTMADVLDELDHSYLNDLKPFQNENPTSENIAKYLFETFSGWINDDNCQVKEVEVFESENASVTYWEQT